MNGFRTYLINLDRSPDRLQTMACRLESLGLTWERVAAVEGRTIDLAAHPGVSERLYQRFHGKHLSAAEVGCYLSHVEVMRRFLADVQARHALVLEDDVQFAPDFVQVLEDLMRFEGLWDMVKLSGFHSGTPYRKQPLNGGRYLSVMWSRHTGSAAYVINRRAAERYLKGLLPMYLPYDHVFDKGWKFGLRIRLVTPMPTALDWDLSSTIGATVKNLRFPWYRRLTTYGYRAWNELRRVAYAAHQTLT